MSDVSTLNDIATVVGVTLGFCGFVLGLLNHYRDRAKVKVTLLWDMNVTENPTYDSRKMWCIIQIANIGRRPIYVSHAALKVPKGYTAEYEAIMEGIPGKKLSEGDKPLQYTVSQEGLEQYAADWREIRAQVSDTTGKEWISEKLPRTRKPSWAKVDSSGPQRS